ncbi:hypothetical protein [Nocardioides xinjiangensis]|uniref:hypothetical protein n=1 Tax=Nocardioides xinjiangensis TaxID=2817376 RepID=UPI001B30FCEA|nr:hypothetical protein [Nocardioides sp. SYSU D00778]
MTTLEPYGKWPRHKVGAWNTTYGEAKARGWQLRKHSSHNSTYLVCPTEECVLGPIWSTASGTENVAQEYLRDVRNCPHGSDEQVTRVQRTRDHLRVGETFADAAERQLKAQASRAKVEDLWQEADQQADAADELLHPRDDDAIIADLEESEWWAGHHEKEAQATLSETDLAGETDPSTVVQAAEDAADDAADALEEVSAKHDERAELEAQLNALRAKNEGIRDQIDDQVTDT